jgi:pantoate--beta-alanine ligase
MILLRTLPELRAWRAAIAPELSVGFVPTMGALHAGHMKLVEECRRGCDVTVVSIFVNPLQFGPSEDLARYPRPFENDAALCAAAGADAIFAPEAAGFYGADHATYVDVAGLDRHLCGASRPGHFRGVCTVVLKLFNLVKPRRAYFGQKDIQQFLILAKMVEDLAVEVEMIGVETVRETAADSAGLALSSRNAYLTPEQRRAATSLYRGLTRARAALEAGERNAEALKALIRAEIEGSSPTRVDYVEIVSRSALAPLETVEVPAVMAVAVFYGTTRLIDNVLVE